MLSIGISYMCITFPPCLPNPFRKEFTLTEKNILLEDLQAILFPFGLDPIQKGGKNENGCVPCSLKVYQFT